MAVYLFANVVTVACLALAFRKYMPRETLTAAPQTRTREWISASFAMMFLMSFIPLLSHINVLILGATQGSTEAGLYGAAFRVANNLQLPVGALIVAIAPMAAEFYAKGDIGGLHRVTRFGVWSAFSLAVTISLVLAVAGEWILGFLGHEFVSAYGTMMILTLGQLSVAAVAPASILLNMTGHQNDSAVIMLCCAIGNILLTAALVPAFGSAGAASALAITLAIWSTLTAAAVYRRTGIVAVISSPWHRIGRSQVTQSNC